MKRFLLFASLAAITMAQVQPSAQLTDVPFRVGTVNLENYKSKVRDSLEPGRSTAELGALAQKLGHKVIFDVSSKDSDVLWAATTIDLTDAWVAEHNGSRSSAADPAPPRLGIVNLKDVAAACKEGKKAAEELTRRFTPRRKDLERQEAEIEDIKRRLAASSPQSSDRSKLTDDIDRRTVKLKRENDQAAAEFGAAERNLVNTIGLKVMKALDEWALVARMHLVLDASSPQSQLVWTSGALDITTAMTAAVDAVEARKKPAGSPVLPERPRGALVDLQKAIAECNEGKSASAEVRANSIRQKALRLLDEKARADGLHLILDVSSRAGKVIWFDKALDITPALIALLNSREHRTVQDSAPASPGFGRR